MDCVKRRPGAERIDQESAEATHQSPSEGADCEVAIGRTRSPSLPGYRKGRVHGAEPPQGMGRAEASAASVRIPRTREGDQGICGGPAFRNARDLTCQPDSVGDRGVRPCGLERNVARGSWLQVRGATSPVSGTKEQRRLFRVGGRRENNKRSCSPHFRFRERRPDEASSGGQARDCLLHEAKASREGESEVHVPGQVTVEASRQRSSERDRCQYFRMDVGDSRSPSPRADGGKPEEIGRIGQAAEDAFDLTDQSQDSAYRPSAAASAAARIATAGQAATCRAAKATTCCTTKATAGCAAKEATCSAASSTGNCRSGGDSGAEVTVGSWSEDAADQTQGEESTAYRRAESGGGREFGSGSPRYAQESREGYRDPQEREGVLGVGIGCEESTEVSGAPDRRAARTFVSHRAIIRARSGSDRMGEGTCPPREGRGRTPKGEGAVSFRENGPGLGTRKGDPASSAGRVRERKTRSPAMEGRRGRSREFEKGEANLSRATRHATASGRSSSDAGADGNVGTDGDGGGESLYAARSASSTIVRGRDCVPQATAGASVQVFGQEGRREVGRDVRSVGREGRHDIQSVQVPPKRGVEPPIRARAHFSNPAFDVVRKKEVVCTVESEPEFEFEYPIELRGNRLAKHILQSHTPYDPSCAVCLTSKGLKRAPKRTDQVTNEVQMDIANLCTHPKSPNMYRYVVIWNRTHGMIATAAIYVDQASTIRVLTAAINHCSSTGAMVLSDEGRDLTALISELIRLKVVSRHETSRPGRHATGAERAVRTLKTQLGCIRTVLYQHGLMLGSESLRYAAANACHVHNAFQLQANSSLTPYQRMRISVTSSGEVPNTNRVMPFGCLVFARPTDGYLEKVREANARHFVPGIYLTPKLSSLGHFVAFDGSQDETVVVPVRDLKIASPIRFVAGLPRPSIRSNSWIAVVKLKYGSLRSIFWIAAQVLTCPRGTAIIVRQQEIAHIPCFWAT